MKSSRNERNTKRLVGVLLISFLLFISSVWVVFDELFEPLDASIQTYTVPHFEGKREAEIRAEEWLEVEREYRYDADVPAGVVLSQSPSGGSLRKISADRPTCKLRLVVSLGEQTATLPNVVGEDVRVAESILRAVGFAVKCEISTGAYPEGEVFDMKPNGGTVLPVGETVTLYASAGTPAVTVEVPDLRGLTRGEALMRLWLSQLSVAEVLEEDSQAVAGTVIRQNYQPGTIVMAGTRLTLTVSREWE